MNTAKLAVFRSRWLCLKVLPSEIGASSQPGPHQVSGEARLFVAPVGTAAVTRLDLRRAQPPAHTGNIAANETGSGGSDLYQTSALDRPVPARRCRGRDRSTAGRDRARANSRRSPCR